MELPKSAHLLNIEYVPVDSIKPYKRNARKHADFDVDAIAASIEQFGFDDPIGIWKDEIVEGHGRLMAAKKLGMEKVPIIRLDHLTDEERRAYALAHNKTAENSAWDLDLRSIELADITDIDMSLFGFFTEEAHEEYVDDFFDRGVEANEKEPAYAVEVTCVDQDQVDECLQMLKDAGYVAKQK